IGASAPAVATAATASSNGKSLAATPVAANTASAPQRPAQAAANTAQPASGPAQSAAPQRAAGGGVRTFEDNWRRIVHDGVVPNTAATTKTVSANTAFLSQPAAPAANNGPFEISVLPDPCVYDGRFTNNGWLQELPNPLNKITWDNVALISPNTARRLNLNRAGDSDQLSGGGGDRPISFINSKGSNMFSDLVTLNYQGAAISKPVPAWITPGQPDDVVTIFMGYGRTRAGRVGNGIGYNAFEVMRSDAMNFGTGTISAVGERATITSTQIHFNMEGRDIVRVWDFNNIDNELAIVEEA